LHGFYNFFIIEFGKEKVGLVELTFSGFLILISAYLVSIFFRKIKE